MKDTEDKQTLELPIKRGRGRPPTGKAMTAAQKQKAYRERKRKEIEEQAIDYGGLKRVLEREYQRNERLRHRIIELEATINLMKMKNAGHKKDNN